MELGEELLRVKGIGKTYQGMTALHNISFSIHKGECLGVVGESGSGKSTLAKCVLQVEKADQGEIWFQGVPLRKRTTNCQMQAVFQNPTSALNPKLKIIDSLMEPLDCSPAKSRAIFGGSKESRWSTAERLVEMVGLSATLLHRYPHELSGGQKQRISIARAISIEPELIIMDEPTASLDVLIQAEILDLLKDLQEELGFSYLFISHDLAAVNYMSSRVLVMRNGEIVDQCKREELFSSDRHMYTQQLLGVYDDH